MKLIIGWKARQLFSHVKAHLKLYFAVIYNLWHFEILFKIQVMPNILHICTKGNENKVCVDFFFTDFLKNTFVLLSLLLLAATFAIC